MSKPPQAPRAAAGGSCPSPAPLSVPAQAIDASLRFPLWALFGGAAFWLLLGSLLAFFASIKMHAPGMLSNLEWFTYGRVRPAATHVFLYGFAIQAGLGAILWLLARLGRTTLVGSITVTVAAKVWNVGVLLGLGGILAGGGTGYERFEMPGYAAGALFASLMPIGLCALLTFHNRRVEELYPSQWYLVGALIWLPWLLSTAWLALVVWPLRGAAQMGVQAWYSNGLFELFLVPVGVATLLYFIPLQANRPLHSRYLAMFAFWTQALFASWVGIHNGAPLPAWMVGMSAVCGVLLLVPVLATGLNLFRTLLPLRPQANPSAAGRFFLFGGACYLVAGLLGVLNSVPSVNRATQFTLFGPGLEMLAFHGFYASVALGAIYHVAPLLAGVHWPAARLVRIHFWLHLAGVVLGAGALMVGGFIHGSAWNDPNIQPLDVARKTLPFIGSATGGNLLILAGSGCFVWNAALIVWERCRACSQPWLAAIKAPVGAVEVKA